MRKRKTAVGLLFAVFVLLWLKAEELLAAMQDLLSSFAEVLAVVPTPFWVIVGMAFLIGTVIVSGGLLLRLLRRDSPPAE